ncbi:MAG: hypothetical protein WBB17_04645 [Saprospiraceae bacterium]
MMAEDVVDDSLKWKVVSGKWKVESRKWKVESGKWKVESLTIHYRLTTID